MAVSAPHATLSLAAIVAESARKYPHDVAVVDGDIRLTYRDLWDRARRVAAALHEQGVRPGDRVALMIGNVSEFPVVYFGILTAGAVVVPVHLLLTAAEVAYVLRDSEAKLIVCHGQTTEVAIRAADEAHVAVAASGALSEGTTTAANYVSRSAEDPAVVFYTSGTTGAPKGAVLTHLNMVLNATVSALDANDVRKSDIVLGCLPLFHAFGQTATMNAAFRVGATIVLLPRFSGDAAVEMMVREGVDVFHGVPTMYIALLDAARAADCALPSLRTCISGGASLPVNVLDEFAAAFATTVYEGYGLSETAPVACANQAAYGTRPGTVGRPVWGVDVEIADPERELTVELLPDGEVGEIVIRGHNIFAGYLNRPDATAEAVVDGWFRTGDLGTKDADGFVTVVDRKKDVIIRGGFNVYPREVEDVLSAHPAVSQVAVIGLPDAIRGEEVCAVVVPADPTAGFDPTTLIEWSRSRLAKHKYPRQVHVVDVLPTGPSHKVLKRELRETFSRT
ncbi:long-chain fatty acid--CoA ligase [Rhodococcus sp. NPDC057529]|uniref:long-chain-fatty-acid--CoA ligase n=1 Tax=Rhodococcus sp. NPDC057529 TaxID=3346158 RepID=UPI003672D470